MKQIIYCVFFILGPYVVDAQPGYISTFAASNDFNIAVDNSGKVYVARVGHVYRLDSFGIETVVAGGGATYGDGGQATNAKLVNAVKVAFDPSGNMYIADRNNGVIRKVTPAGIISTVAGDSVLGPGYTGAGGPATSARIRCNYICVDQSSNIYIADETGFCCSEG